MTAIRRFAWFLVGCLLTLLACVLAVFIALQSEWVRSRLLTVAESSLADAGFSVEVRDLQGILPIDFAVGHVSISDADGPWLSIDEFRFAWDPWKLLRGEIRVLRLSVVAAELLRLPPPSTPAETEEASSSTLAIELPEIPEALPTLVLEHLAIDRLTLGPAVVGETLVLEIQGQMQTLSGPEATASLTLKRVDDPSLQASLQVHIAGRPAQLDLTFAAEDRGELVRRLVGLPGGGPVTARLEGSGPASEWTGQLGLTASGVADLDATLRLALEPQLFFEIEGGVAPDSNLLTADLSPLIGPRPEFHLVVAQSDTGRLALERLDATIATAGIAVTGQVDLDDSTFNAQVDLTVPDLAMLSELAGGSIEGDVRLAVSANGPLDQPAVRARLEGKDVAGYGTALNDIRLDAELALEAPVGAPSPGAEVSVLGSADGLTVDGLPSLPLRNVMLEGRFSAPTFEKLTIDSINLRGGGAQIDLAGRVDLETLVGAVKAKVGLIEIGPWAAAFGSPVAADAFKLDATAEFDVAKGDVIAELTSRVLGVHGLPEAVSPLVGSDIDLSTKATLTHWELIRVQSLSLSGALATLTANAEAALKSGDVAASVRASLPDLKPFSALAGAEIGGEAVLSADVGGTFASPDIEARLQVDELVYAGRDLRRLAVNLSALDVLTAPSGEVDLTAGPENAAIGLAAQFALSGRDLGISALSLSGPRTRWTGEFVVDLNGPSVTGDLVGGVEDLRALVFWHGDSTLEGALTANVDLQPRDGEQGVRLAAEGRDLGGGFGSLERLKADLNLADAMGDLGIDAVLLVERFVSGGVSIDRSEVRARGVPSKLAINLGLSGEVLKALNLDAQVDVEAGPEGTKVVLRQISGDFAERRISLDEPATVELVGSDIRVTALRLGYGDARLAADARYGSERLAGKVVLESLPLALVGEFADLEVDGVLGATLKLSGTPAVPDMALNVSARNIALLGQDLGNLPPGNVSLDATLGKTGLDVSLLAEQITSEPVRLRAELPVDFALEPLRFALDDDDALGGALQARLDLGRLSRLIELDEQTLEGLLNADLTLAGTLSRPEMTGAVTLAQGKYENGASGTLLHGIEARVAAAGRTVRLESLQATDGQQGRLSGRGELSLEQNEMLDFSAGLELDNVVLLRSRNLNLTLSGDVSVAGDPQSGSAGGNLTVNQAEYRIPSRFGPTVPTIEVEEVYDGEPLAVTPTASSPTLYDLALDIGIAIPSRVFVRGRGLESEWTGALNVSGAAQEPKIVGKLEVRRGYFDFLDRRFDLSRGLIEFFGSTPPNPTIDIEARSQGAEVVAIIGLQGAAGSPELRLESEPELPEDEVLSRLLFDSDSSNLTAAQTLQLAAAVRELSGQGGGGIMAEVRGATGLDTLDVGATATGGSVEAGRYLTEDIFLEVITGFGDQPSRVRVEKELTRQFSIETDVDQNSNSSFGINWRLDY